MSEPRVPGGRGEALELPCGRTVQPSALDLGMRELSCDCGDDHAVVMDVHPPTRFVPEFLVEVLETTVEVEDDFGEFGTPHLMGAVIEEFPDRVAVHDASDDGNVGYALVWVTEFDARRCHEVVVELVVELMEHALSHADDGAQVEAFESEMAQFDVESFVDQYRAERDWDSAADGAA